MKLVIDIPDDEYAEVKALRYPVLLEKAVQDGQPLSEILDKISAEIKQAKYEEGIQSCLNAEYFVNEGLDRALDIVEKYKAESEGEEC